MEGLLSVPPDRGTIIGRAVWKMRYVVVGGASREQMQLAPINRNAQSNRISTPMELSRMSAEGVFLSIYKSKEDTEPIQQHSINSIADCQVQMLAHRKQGPVLPTLVINVLPDPSLDKARKRRSSRTAGFSSPRDTGPITLLFRPGDEHQSLQDWARCIQHLIQPHIPDRAPLSPLTPASPTFINPFAPRSRDAADTQRPGSGYGSRPGIFKNPSQPPSVRDRPVTFSDSPSLRSKRSDLSSQTSSLTQSHMGYQNYTTMVPADLPSPATTIGEYQGEFIEGWTSAQGRSSALNSPMRGRDSVSSQAPTSLPPIPDSNSPSGPRETILDRAFQMRCIPGSEREVPGEEKLSSLARFDALMREMDEKRRQREAAEARERPQAGVTTSAKAELPESRSAFDDDGSDSDLEEEEDDSDEIVEEADVEDEFPASTPAQRALDYIAGRYEATQRRRPASSRAHGFRSTPSYNHDAFMALSSSGPSQTRPQTGYSKHRSRPGMAQRTHSQPHLATILASSTPLDVARDSEESNGFSFTPGSPSALHRSSTEKRASTSSAKRLSFTEFTRRLSSTSSLLLMQTNASGPASSRASNSDMDLQQQLPSSQSPQHLHHLHPRAGPPASLQHQQPPQSPPQTGDRERCAWRGSCVFGAGEGGFM
ncbi:hypothetical protein N657DRAFT_653771 [Parathielavia appendiculata]|uniref:Uncharacterized protein n=1 Tax=Parathielavia appendiculata TaxID=2587402 RepID=A0AAN6Z779_9PEZI|nr:hypothetical protein N657DRAFT_653771 [Parathielavia appendiculata]